MLSGSCVPDVRGQRAGVAEPVPRAAAVLRRAGARVPGARALPAAAAPVSKLASAPSAADWPFYKLTSLLLQIRDHGHRVPVGARQKREPVYSDNR